MFLGAQAPLHSKGLCQCQLGLGGENSWRVEALLTN